MAALGLKARLLADYVGPEAYWRYLETLQCRAGLARALCALMLAAVFITVLATPVHASPGQLDTFFSGAQIDKAVRGKDSDALIVAAASAVLFVLVLVLVLLRGRAAGHAGRAGRSRSRGSAAGSGRGRLATFAAV